MSARETSKLLTLTQIAGRNSPKTGLAEDRRLKQYKDVFNKLRRKSDREGKEEQPNQLPMLPFCVRSITNITESAKPGALTPQKQSEFRRLTRHKKANKDQIIYAKMFSFSKLAC
jgi:hypothetical protein